MSEAIYYVTRNRIEQSYVDNSSGFFVAIPEQAIPVPIGNILNKDTLLANLAKACDFPSWFGHNWDATWDCLTDSDIEYLALDLTLTNDINSEDFNVFKNLVEDAFKEFGKPQLWIIMASDDFTQSPIR
ncbi:barstar family protein [Psychrobacter sp. S4(2024)]|uniref:barstar family protein n=1 Tax=Psychrobacter sp. S4(2024) TaxID=3111913 RepID=UPI002FE1385A